MQLCVSSAYNVSISLKIVAYRVVNYLGILTNAASITLAAFVRMRLSFARCLAVGIFLGLFLLFI